MGLCACGVVQASWGVVQASWGKFFKGVQGWCICSHCYVPGSLECVPDHAKGQEGGDEERGLTKLVNVILKGLSAHLTMPKDRKVEMKDVATPNSVNSTGTGGTLPCWAAHHARLRVSSAVMSVK